MGKRCARVTARESLLMKTLHNKGDGVGKIADRPCRFKDTVHKHVFRRNARHTAVMGRPKEIDNKLFVKIMAKYEAMLSKAYKGKGPKEVTVRMLHAQEGDGI